MPSCSARRLRCPDLRWALPLPLLAGLLLAVTPAAAPLHAQADTTRLLLSGTVVDPQQQPLEGVEVRLVGDSLKTFTSRAGIFRLYPRRAAELLLQFRRPGYKAQLLKVKGEWSGTVMLVPGVFELPDIRVTARNAKPAEYAFTAKYDDFFRRRKLGFGEFIMKEELDRRAALHTSEIFEGRHGIRVSSQPGRGTSVDFARCHEYPPRINVYVNGRKLIPPGGLLSSSGGSMWGGIAPRKPEIAGVVGEMLSRVNPSEIELIEIYRGPGELPAEFNDGNCGAIVLWTR